MEKDTQTDFKGLIEQSGFTVKHLAKIIDISPNHLSSFINGTKTLSKLRQSILKSYLTRVIDVKPVEI